MLDNTVYEELLKFHLAARSQDGFSVYACCLSPKRVIVVRDSETQLLLGLLVRRAYSSDGLSLRWSGVDIVGRECGIFNRILVKVHRIVALRERTARAVSLAWSDGSASDLRVTIAVIVPFSIDGNKLILVVAMKQIWFWILLERLW